MSHYSGISLMQARRGGGDYLPAGILTFPGNCHRRRKSRAWIPVDPSPLTQESKSVLSFVLMVVSHLCQGQQTVMPASILDFFPSLPTLISFQSNEVLLFPHCPHPASLGAPEVTWAWIPRLFSLLSVVLWTVGMWV